MFRMYLWSAAVVLLVGGFMVQPRQQAPAFWGLGAVFLVASIAVTFGRTIAKTLSEGDRRTKRLIVGGIVASVVVVVLGVLFTVVGIVDDPVVARSDRLLDRDFERLQRSATEKYFSGEEMTPAEIEAFKSTKSEWNANH